MATVAAVVRPGRKKDIMTQPMAPQGQPVQQPQLQPQPQPQKPKDTSVCGILGVVFGAIGFVLSFIPIINNAAVFFGIVGAVLAIVAIVGTFRGKKNGKALSIVGAVLSVLAIVITLSMQASFSKAFDEASGASSSTSSSSSSASADSNGSANSTDGDDSASGDGVQDQEGDLEDAHVKIVSAVKSVDNYNGQPTVLVTYEWTNKTDKNTSFMVATSAKVFQNGQQLDTAIYGMDAPEGYDSGSSMKDLQPGATGTVTEGYVLKDDSPVTVEVTDLFSLDDKAKVAHTFDL